jgi:hypothetical protein
MTRYLRAISLLMLTAILGALVLMPSSAAAQPVRNQLLSDIPVTGELEDGGTFEGLLNVTGFNFVDGVLNVTGTLSGTATDALGNVTEIVDQVFTVAATLTGGGQQGGCQILFLDIGPIFLDLLGLQVDLSQIVLDITAVPGPGRLLGNLLCAVAGLLDPGGGLLGSLNRLLGLLDRINNLLG